MPKKQNGKTPEAPKLPRTRVVRSPHFRTIYTNFVQSSFTPFDISVTLSENAGFNESEEIVIEQQARLVMAPLEARVLLRVLDNTIKLHERQFGKIPDPAGVLPEVLPDDAPRQKKSN
jgi:hypothetical protein